MLTMKYPLVNKSSAHIESVLLCGTESLLDLNESSLGLGVWALYCIMH